MASNISLWSLVVFFAFSLAVQGALGRIVECEKLSDEECAFAVSSEGKRCVLEKKVKRSGEDAYTCRTSEIEADNKLIKDHIESEQCINSCGLDRKSLGISSDSLLDSTQFTQKLCSPNCYQSCPNVVDLYFNLAAGEGVFLPKLCENGRRGMAEIKSSGIVAPGPVVLRSSQFTAPPANSPLYPNFNSVDAAEFTAETPLVAPAYPPF